MTVRRLRTLVAVAETKTFSAAAEVVHITHAAVSQQMQALEADLGITLFDRSTRTPRLTPAAHQIVARARRLIADYDTLVSSVIEDGGLDGTIKLGVLRTTLTGLVPQAMAVLKAKYPDLGIYIQPGLTATLLAEIERGNLDAAITTRPHLMPVGVVFHELAVEPMHLIAAVEEPLDDPMQLLATRPFIRFDRTAVVGALIDNWILSRKLQVNEAMELDSPEAIASMVHSNLGVSIVPDPVVKPPDAIRVKRLSLGADAPHRTLGLVHTQDPLKTKAIDELQTALSGVIAAAQS
ncbi:LysR family transcriptional regulator [Tateyamaria sp. SN6-1]|uniref:LysR family transcriptional regulator n=1 Tax=Tateyamaria sp. SN6-1 TaxID=3092148 RepID=UPI0039F59EB1